MNKPAALSAAGAIDPVHLAGGLSASATASLLATIGDLTLLLTADGTILDVAAPRGDLANHGIAAWVGDAWIDTVTVESRPKVAEMLAAARAHAPGAQWRQVNHPAAGGDIPVTYLTIALGDERVVAIGRDLRGQAAMQQRLLQTQQSLERDYVRLRQAEMRYRLLFDIATEPMLIVDADTRRIREANPAAHALVGAAEGSLAGEPVASLAAPAAREDFVARLGAAGAVDDAAAIPLALRDREGRRGAEVRVTARLFRQGRAAMLLLRLDAATAGAEATPDAALDLIVARMPDAFVLADRNLDILSANAAFVELAEASSADRLTGQRLGGWLGRPGIDLELIVAQLREHEAVRNVSTIMRGSAGSEQEIELSAVAAPTPSGEMCYGFVIRGVARRLRDAPAIQRDMPRSVEQLTELVGRVSLKDIVRESTDLVERLCIEAALAYTADNRASAAEILGVSRQSLYSKLHRHGLGNLVSSDD